MSKIYSIVVAFALATLLSACGGSSSCGNLTNGSSSTSSSCGGGTVAGVGSVSVTSSSASIPSDGSSTASITVLVKDSNNNAMNNVPVALSSSAGTLVAAAQATNSSGTVTATLSGQGVSAGTAITVTGTAGGVSGKASINVVNTQRTITLQTDLSGIHSDGSNPATISAIVKDSNNNLVSGLPVTFQVSSGAVAPVQTTVGKAASVPAGTTDANGLAQATVSTGGDQSNRPITVTATAGAASSTITVTVSGTNLSQPSCPASLVLNTTGNCSVSLTNSAGQGIPNATVSFTSANGNGVSPASIATDSSGRAVVTLTASKGGKDTITATATVTAQEPPVANSATVNVSTQSFTIVANGNSNGQVNLGVSQQLTVSWLNNGIPVAQNTPVTFAATNGTLTATSALTNASGQATVSISSNSAGPAIVQASGGSGANAVSAQVNLLFVATTPSQIAVQPQPSAVGLQGTSQITATVRDANNNPVAGITVNFARTTDPTGGQLSAASATTDFQGQAQVVYTAGNSSSGANGVTVTATVSGTSITASTNLTVGGQAVFLSLGTGNTIDTSQGPAVYQVIYTVFAVDSHGAPVPNIPITMTVLPVAYGKGVLTCPTGATYWAPAYSTPTSDPQAYTGFKSMCNNEDTDYTGNIASQDVNPIGTCTNLTTNTVIPQHKKDYNCNGQLDPGNVAVVAPSSGTTDTTGRLDVKVTYPRDHSYWVEVTLIASTTVQGTQSSTSATFVLRGAQADYSCSIGPPGPVSPYGTANSCANPN